MTELGKKVWDKMEEIGWENAPEGFHLEYYENIIECTKQALTIPVVVERSEQLVCDVCGSDDVIEAPHMGRNCNQCHPLIFSTLENN